MSTTSREAVLDAPGASIGGGVTVVSLSATLLPEAALAMAGPWTMARSGDRVCTIELGTRDVGGSYAAGTSRCTSVELARIAAWTPSADGLELYDFERRPVVAFRRSGPDLYEGVNADGARVTLWR